MLTFQLAKMKVKRLRQCVHEAGAGNEIEILPSFLMFEQDALMYTKKLKRHILTFSECVQAGLPQKMSQKEVQAALIYPKVLSNLVFTQVPHDFVNKVVTFNSYLPAEYGISLKNGIISREMLQKPLSSCFIEFPQAITLFTHLSVVAAI